MATCLGYVDNVFLLWKDTEGELNQFCEYLNSRHELIEFTMTKDKNTIYYLDVEIKKEGASLCTVLFSKPTDQNNMLKCDSFSRKTNI